MRPELLGRSQIIQVLLAEWRSHSVILRAVGSHRKLLRGGGTIEGSVCLQGIGCWIRECHGQAGRRETLR